MSSLQPNEFKRVLMPAIFQREPLELVKFSLVSYGINITLCTNDSRLFNYLSEYLPPAWEPSTCSDTDILYSLVVKSQAERRRYCLHRDGEKLIDAATIEDCLDCFDSDLRLQIAITVKDKLFVHAGVVGWNGRAIVIPGRSFSGKTTLVAALVRAGATYYSDEYAVFDVKGLVHPYPRPLSVRQCEGSRVKRYLVEELGGCAGTTPLSVGLIIYTQYELGADWAAIQMSPGHAVLALLDNTIVAQLRPDFVLPILSNVVCKAISMEGKRGEVDKTVEMILQNV